MAGQRQGWGLRGSSRASSAVGNKEVAGILGVRGYFPDPAHLEEAPPTPARGEARAASEYFPVSCHPVDPSCGDYGSLYGHGPWLYPLWTYRALRWLCSKWMVQGYLCPMENMYRVTFIVTQQGKYPLGGQLLPSLEIYLLVTLLELS